MFFLHDTATMQFYSVITSSFYSFSLSYRYGNLQSIVLDKFKKLKNVSACRNGINQTDKVVIMTTVEWHYILRTDACHLLSSLSRAFVNNDFLLKVKISFVKIQNKIPIFFSTTDTHVYGTSYIKGWSWHKISALIANVQSLIIYTFNNNVLFIYYPYR